MKNILVTGGAGYVGSRLVPNLLDLGYKVYVFDWMIYGNHLPSNPNLICDEIDLRNSSMVEERIKKIKPEAVIDLASISNDPMGDLNPQLTKEVNIIAQKNLIDSCIKNNVRRFIFASSASVYGINENENIAEDTPLAPISLYSKTKVEIESYIKEKTSDEFSTVRIRPATVCGVSPRQRLDLIVNLLTYKGYYEGKIVIEGGERIRPHIHIDDMVNAYLALLEADSDVVNGKVYNCGAEYMSLAELGAKVQSVTNCDIATADGPDTRSHRLNSERIKKELGFTFENNVGSAISDLVAAFDNHFIAIEDKRCFNMRWYKYLLDNDLLGCDLNDTN